MCVCVWLQDKGTIQRTIQQGKVPNSRKRHSYGTHREGGWGGEAGPGGGRGDGAVHGVLAGLALALRTPAPVIVAGPNTLQRVLYVYVHMHTQMHLHTYAHYRCAHTSVYICALYLYYICVHTHMHTRVTDAHTCTCTHMNSNVGMQRDRESCKRARECVCERKCAIDVCIRI